MVTQQIAPDQAPDATDQGRGKPATPASRSSCCNGFGTQRDGGERPGHVAERTGGAQAQPSSPAAATARPAPLLARSRACAPACRGAAPIQPPTPRAPAACPPPPHSRVAIAGSTHAGRVVGSTVANLSPLSDIDMSSMVASYSNPSSEYSVLHGPPIAQVNSIADASVGENFKQIYSFNM